MGIHAPTCIRHERLELGRASTFTHVPRCLVDLFAGDREAAVLGIEAQLAQLRFRALLARRYARVDRQPRRHHPSSAQQSPVLYTRD